MEERPRVLFIDPDPELLKKYAGYFQYLHNMEVTVATNRRSAFKCIDRLNGPTIVILERWLDVLGEFLISELRLRSRYPLVFIAHSEDRSIDFELRAIRAGAFWIVPKDRRDASDHKDRRDGDRKSGDVSSERRDSERRYEDRSLEVLLTYIFLARFVLTQMTEPHYDPLTRASNRHLMFNDAVRELSHAARTETMTACLMIDVDRLKYVNDTYGHAAGDKIILCVADAVKSHLRSTDIFARTGGDEFVLILPNTGRADAVNFANMASKTIEGKIIPIDSKGTIKTSVSIGVRVLTPNRIASKLKKLSTSKNYLGRRQEVLVKLLEKVIEEADKMMYKVKNKKKTLTQ